MATESAFQPIGQGTANELLKADLFWTGSFVKSGIYYVVVQRDPIAEGVCSYQLRVTGEDVSLIQPRVRLSQPLAAFPALLPSSTITPRTRKRTPTALQLLRD
ncbi:MAG: hypothetical protein R2867_34985 [Caldilineaceae bacterium]